MINLVTKAVTPDKVKQDICCIEEVGVAKMDIYLQERIKTEQENIWALMQKVQLYTWSASLKKKTCSNIRHSCRIKRRQRVICENGDCCKPSS